MGFLILESVVKDWVQVLHHGVKERPLQFYISLCLTLMRIQATSHVKMCRQTKGEVPDQQRHLLLQHLRSAMMPMPCGLCSSQVHRQCAHEQDVHTCCSLPIVDAFILPVWIVQQHPSLPRILLPNLKFNMPNCSIYIIQLSITTLLSSARTLFMWVRFSRQLLLSSSSSTFIPSWIYLLSTLSGRSKATKQIPLAGGAHGCKSWERNQTPATQWTLLPRRLQRQKPCLTEFFLVSLPAWWW